MSNAHLVTQTGGSSGILDRTHPTMESCGEKENLVLGIDWPGLCQSYPSSPKATRI